MIKEQLRSLRAALKEMDQLREQLASMEARMYAPSGQILSDMPKAPSPAGAGLDSMASAHIQLQEQYKSYLESTEHEILRVEKLIAALPVGQRMVIRYRYISGLEWEEICERMHYSWTHVHRMHAAALQRLESE